MARWRRGLPVAACVFVAVTCPGLAGSLLRADVPGKLEPVPGPPGGTPFVLFRGEPGAPGKPAPLFRAGIRGGRITVEEAGHLPPRTLAVELLPAAAGSPPACLVSLPGKVGLLPAGAGGTFHPEDLVSLLEDPRLAADRLLHPDLDGDGTGDLLVETWAGVLLLRRTGPRRWDPRGWLPLPRAAYLAGGAVHVRARPPAPPAPGPPPRTLWARDHSEGEIVVFRGAPVEAARPHPGGGKPPLVARVRLPGGPRSPVASILVPGTPDRVVLVDVASGWLGPRGRPRLLACPLAPRDAGVPAAPELASELPLDPRRGDPLLAVADADGDGTRDLLAGGVSRGSSRAIAVLVFRGLGAGRFTADPLVFRARAGKSAALLSVRDLDGDGRPDLLAVARGSVLWWKGEAPRPGTLPWPRQPTARWTVPGRGSLPGPPLLLNAGSGRRLVFRHLLPDGRTTRLLALPLPSGTGRPRPRDGSRGAAGTRGAGRGS